MNAIQLKTLKHVIKTLDSFDTFETYRAINTELTNNKVDMNIIKSINQIFFEKMEVEIKKIRDSKEWIDAILNTEKTN